MKCFMQLLLFGIVLCSTPLFAASITIINPKPPITYNIGDVVKFGWSSTDIINVDIFVSTNNGKTWLGPINAGTSLTANGTYEWQIPCTMWSVSGGMPSSVSVVSQNVVFQIINNPQRDVYSSIRNFKIIDPNIPPVINNVSFAATQDPSTFSFIASASDPDADALVYTWDFGDGNFGLGTAVTHKYCSPLTYNVKLTVDDGKCHTVTSTMMIVVNTVTTQPDWKQHDFVIGAFVDPYLVVNDDAGNILRYERYLAANFNTIVRSSGQPVGISNEYSLSLAAQINRNHGYTALRVSVTDEVFAPPAGYRPSPLVSSTAAFASTVCKYKNLSNDDRSAMLGYSLIDEPAATQFGDILLQHNSLLQLDNEKLTWVNFGPDVNTLPDIANHYNNPSTRVASFDLYPFQDRPILSRPKGYFPEKFYFKFLQAYAANSKRTGKTFWMYSSSTEQLSPAKVHFAYPTEMILRYGASAPIIYGSKGLLWFTYEKPGNTPSGWSFPTAPNDGTPQGSAIYNLLQKINGEIKNMGSTLMTLSWQKTVHGTALDPVSDEQNLPVIDANSSPLYFVNTLRDVVNPGTGVDDSRWSADSLAIGIFKRSNYDYLLIMNKSVFLKQDGSCYVGFTNNTKYTVRGKVWPRLFNKQTGAWQTIGRTYNLLNNTTSFELIINPGDMQMVWLGPADITPILNLLLDN